MADPDNGLRPHRAARVVEILTQCLALVKPAGMQSADAEAWLGAAAQELRHIPADLLESAAGEARRECTHHGQIVPLIVKAVGERWQWRKQRRADLVPERTLPAPKPERWQPTPEEIAELKANAAESLRA